MPGAQSSSSPQSDGLMDSLRPSEDKRFRQIGAIDIGSNSTHLLVASIDSFLNTFTIELAEKSTTRLGERDIDTGKLTESSMKRTLETLKRFKDLAASYKVEELIIAATSAVREATNGQDFLNQIQEDLSLTVDLVSGAEEARLIYLGVLSGMQFEGKPHLIVDIGGGSTELILADQEEARALTSIKVGAVRLQRDFIKQDPMPASRCEFLKNFIQGSLEPAADKIRRRILSAEEPVMVATSGTALAVGSLVSRDDSNLPIKLHGYVLTREVLDDLIQELIPMTPEQRRRLSALSDRRAEIIVPGALILQATMQLLGMKKLILSERALREGLIVDWMLRHDLLQDQFGFQSTIRERTVLHQANRFSVDIDRAKRVARYALKIYDETHKYLHDDKV